MATVQKLKPCPQCDSEDHLAIYTYDHGGRRVECDKCFYLGPDCSSLVWAARWHNIHHAENKARYAAVEVASK